MTMLCSCNSFLEEDTISEVPADKMWQTARDAKAGVNEIYGLFRQTMRENYFYWGEFRSDNVAPGAPVMADQARVINNLMSTDERCAKWTNLYAMINQANLCIKYVPQIDMPDVSDRNATWDRLMLCVPWVISMLCVYGAMCHCSPSL